MSTWDDRLAPLLKIAMKPVLFSDLSVTLLDALPAEHDRNWEVGFHRHPWFEFNYISQGGFYTTISDTEYLTEAGHFFLIPPGVPHAHRHYQHQGDDGFCLRWKLEVLPHAEGVGTNRFYGGQVLSTLSAIRPTSFKRNMEWIVESAAACGELSMQGAFIQWLLSVYEVFEDRPREKEETSDREKAMVQQVMLYLTSYYGSRFHVQELANSMNVSYRHLARIFKRHTDFTIVEKLNDIRVNQAKVLLKDTDKTIREIALEVGFENEYYFSSIFNQYAYSTPSRFRSRVRQNPADS